MAAAGGGRRRRGADRRALLQQAEPGRHCRPFPRCAEASTCRSSSTMCRRGPSPTSRSRPWPSFAAAERRRGQGRQRQPCPGDRPAARLRRGILPASGNDDMALGFNAMGGVGCISVTANVAPQAVRRVPGGDARGTLGRGAGAPGPALSATRRAVQRRIAGAGEICAVARSARASRPSCACR